MAGFENCQKWTEIGQFWLKLTKTEKRKKLGVNSVLSVAKMDQCQEINRFQLKFKTLSYKGYWHNYARYMGELCSSKLIQMNIITVDMRLGKR